MYCGGQVGRILVASHGQPVAIRVPTKPSAPQRDLSRVDFCNLPFSSLVDRDQHHGRLFLVKSADEGNGLSVRRPGRREVATPIAGQATQRYLPDLLDIDIIVVQFLAVPNKSHLVPIREKLPSPSEPA